MNEEKKKAIEELEYASPLEISRLLQQIELYDEKSSQEVLDEVYENLIQRNIWRMKFLNLCLCQL